MLLTKSVKIKWNGSNRKHYESKGYIFTKFGDEFEVRVEDLPNSSHALVSVQCDCCGKTYKTIEWLHYKKSKSIQHYCDKCHIELNSFEKWCYDNLLKEESDKIIGRWDYNLNKCKPSEVIYTSQSKYYFKCPRNIHESELQSIYNFIKGDSLMGCNKCNSLAEWGITNLGEDFLNKYWDYEKNTVDPYEISYGSSNIKVWIKCQEKEHHNSYDISCNSFTKGRRCPYCASIKIHPLDSLGELLEDKGLLHLWSEENKKSPYEYSQNNDQYIWLKCPNGIHTDFKKRTQSANNSMFKCPDCVKGQKNSSLQTKVHDFILELEYEILHENRCNIIPKNPKTKQLLPYDNEVIINNKHLIIEVHGQQHYEICGWHKKKAKQNNTTPEQELHKRKLYDRYKKIFAKKQGFFYLEIPYWTEKEESYKELIHNKIKEIINKEMD